MIIATKTEKALIMNIGHRTAGSSVIDGKTVEWDEGDFVTVIPYLSEKGQSRKYPIHPLQVKAIEAKLADTNWGSVVELTIDGKNVVDVTVILDYFENIPIM